MTTFEDRERAFEAKYAHDAEMQFRARSRRNRKLGMWAAGLLGREGTDAVDYVRDLQRADLSDPGDRVVFDKLVADLDGRVEDDAIREAMSRITTEAKAELDAEA